MSYQVYDDSSCTLTDDERRAEADRIVRRLVNEDLKPNEMTFVVGRRAGPVSVKQLFYLRDLNDKY